MPVLWNKPSANTAEPAKNGVKQMSDSNSVASKTPNSYFFQFIWAQGKGRKMARLQGRSEGPGRRVVARWGRCMAARRALDETLDGPWRLLLAPIKSCITGNCPVLPSF